MTADAAELTAAFLELGTPLAICDDNLPKCKEWADAGECDKNLGFMHSECRISCNLCPKLELQKVSHPTLTPVHEQVYVI